MWRRTTWICLRRTVSGTAGLLVLLATLPVWAEPAVSLESLLGEMIDRERIATVPAPHYVCRQFSSYDRDTVGKDKPGWFANWDRSQFVRVEEQDGRKEYVLLDAAGPGAVVRFWATWHGPRVEGKLQPFSNGTLRVYLDQEATPRIEGPIADLISGGALVGQPFSESVSPETPYERRGHNLYLPIPYQQHCKITYESEAIIDFGGQRGEALYYQINYRTYESGTSVASFRRSQLDDLKPLLSEVGQRLVDSGPGRTPPLSTTNLDIELPPKSPPLPFHQAEGAGAIRRLTVNLQAEDRQQALRSTILAITFDGRQTVWCPVGDFFGIGHQVHAYRSWYTEVDADGTLRCYWVMPHAKSCQLSLQNLGQQPVKATASVDVSVFDWTDRSMHFHAGWRQLTQVDTGPNKDQTGQGAFDVNYVTLQGQGTVVGDTLTVFNGTNAWWGEGDEKIYIDGEAFPSHVGTGTEDYYGYAWCRPEAFQSPFHAQPCGDGNLAGGFSVNSRYRILDALPFTESLTLDMELWHWRNTQVNYAPTTFWYARPGSTSNLRPDPQAATLPVPKTRSDVVPPRKVSGAIEGEALKVLEVSGGEVKPQEIDQYRWSGNAQLWWIDARPGDRLLLGVPVAEAGSYRVSADLTKAADYGIVRMQLAGQDCSKDLDRYATRVANDVVELGVFQLNQGSNPLQVEIVGANERAIKRHMFGLDYLFLEKVD